jgi:large subunit ribosomal protein L29
MDNKEIKKLSVENLKQEIKNAESTLQKLRFSHAVSPLKNTAQIRDAKKLVARLKTELHGRTLNELDVKVKDGSVSADNGYEILAKQPFSSSIKKKNLLKALTKAMYN